jgi:hypothetical protein
MHKLLVSVGIFAMLLATTGCGYLAAAGAGAAGGYILKDQGYEVQSPIKKNDEEKKTD